ncbi:hypothetical protein MJ257_20405 [Paenibacillus timonensis]|jgi:hypothetical protein|uniref:Uncharacterized protein n=1 Tax=Paenibacillus timonensis TaxID=225915 RepID=A0ABW3SGG2_9BACL|nr:MULTISPECIES: hypothetical protein [Paenibacillus]MCH1642465.1 hypothetical protein [Paenibacillus timonensis]MDU2241251.1 hypothetical protein [Paenibacillus sp.]GJM80461.1 hypothetical protein HMSSN139_29570 [Paenibacillus sp. HMSSN-139]
MNNAVLQELIRLKFRFADQWIDTLPEAVKQTVKSRESELLTVVDEALRERLAGKEDAGCAAGRTNEKSKMNSITIE